MIRRPRFSQAGVSLRARGHNEAAAPEAEHRAGRDSLQRHETKTASFFTFGQGRAWTKEREHRARLQDQAYGCAGDAEKEQEAKHVREGGDDYCGGNRRVHTDPSQEQRHPGAD